MENQKNLKNILNNIKIKEYDLFIFDFDETICDKLDVDWIGLKKKLCNAFLNKPYQEETLSDLLYAVRNLLGKEGIKHAMAITADYENKALSTARIKEEMKEYIFLLKNKQKKLAIFSNNLRNTICHILKRGYLDNQFDLVISKEDVLKYKPDPEGLIVIINTLKVAKEKVIFIGDHQRDQEAGQKAGIKTIII